MSVELNEQFLAKIAGWEAMKQARALIAQGSVVSSNWTPPVLKGVVQEGGTSYRAGLVIKDSIDIENICSCRTSRQWGTICSHSVGVGLHHLNRLVAMPLLPNSRPQPAAAASAKASATQPERPTKQLRRAGPTETGEPIELFVIVPPNFVEAAARGKVMLCFEAKFSRGRTPLNAVPPNTPFQFTPEDAALLDAVEALAGEPPAMLVLQPEDLGKLLKKMAGHPRVTLGRQQRLAVSDEWYRVKLAAALEPSGEIVLRWAGGKPPQLFGSGDAAWVFTGDALRPIGIPAAYLSVLNAPIQLPRSRVPAFLSEDWPRLQASCDVEANFRIEDFVLEPRPPRFLLHLAGGIAHLTAQLQCAYGPRIFTMGVSSSAEGLWLPDPDSPTRYSTRDLAAEQTALSRLKRHGFTGPDVQGRYQLLGQNQVLTFFAREFPKLEKEWEVTLEERLEKSTAKNIERIEPRFEVMPTGEQWFDLGVTYTSTGGDRFSPAEIQRLLLSGQSHTRLKNGKFALIDTGAVEELQEVLLDCAPEQHDGAYRLSNTQAGFLESTLSEHANWSLQAPPEWRQRAAQLAGEVDLKPPPLGQLEDVLRPYQKHGVAWMQFLRQNNFSGILADEMGLGKTLQALAFFVSRSTGKSPSGSPGGEPAASAVTKPSLVVCPTSLVWNWVAEARKFTPGLRVLALQGSNRHASFAEIPNADVVVTSYALIRRDAERYREIEFDTVVLDEAQHIKNRQTQNAQAVKAIRSLHRLVLTGTPLENSVLDLWSIFDFLMPGYLGSADDFRQRYESPIVRERDTAAQTRLARRVRPFLLRRLKRDVAAELPEKIEQVAFCELTAEQSAVYQQVLDASRREVLNAVEANGEQKSRMVILTALLRLRQVCCDLRLLDLPDIDPATASAKVDLFSELLEEVIDGGHRVLVFSQFVSMLSILRDKLSAENVEFCYLDGSTSNRAEVVERFQKDARVPVFLISLKAGGVGLNLTGADTVMHFDPWWNPAVEQQATDRAHRIGQTRVVTSYKLIARNTVEEKILKLQERKKELLGNLVDAEEGLTARLTWEEIQDLLA